MSEQFRYRSVLAPYMKGLLEVKQAASIGSLRLKWIFLEFDKFMTDNDIEDTYITREIISRWRATRINDCERTIYAKYSAWSQLTKYMNRQGIQCHVPQLPKESTADRGFSPYIFTHEQIKAIFSVIDSTVMGDRHMDTSLISMPALFRLLYSTGLRISEALSIKNSDLRLDEGYIVIRKTKNGHERIAPVCESLKAVLVQYLQYRDRMPIRGVAEPHRLLFIKADGRPFKSNSAYNWFKKTLAKCGIKHIGNHYGPRQHDLRHTAACHALMQMSDKGRDVYAGLPVLSAFMGHRSLSATEQYVRLTIEMYPDLAAKTNPINAFIYPKTPGGHHHED